MHLLMTFARAYPWQSVIVLLCLLFAGIAEGFSISIMLPLLGSVLGDQASAMLKGSHNKLMETIAGLGMSHSIEFLLVVMTGSIMLKSVLILLANNRIGYTVAKVATDLRLNLLHALLGTRWQYYLRQPIGRLINAMTFECSQTSLAYLEGATMVAFFLQLILYIILALLVSWPATIASLLVGIGLVSVSHRLIRISRRVGKEQTKLMKALQARLADTLQSVKPIKAMARDELAGTMLTAETQHLNKIMRQQVFNRELLGAIQEPLITIAIAVGIYVALVKLQFPLPEAIVLIILMRRILQHIGKIQRGYQKLVSYESAFHSLQEAIQSAKREREVLEGTQKPELKQGIELVNVTFAYKKNPVLQHLSLNIPAGSFTTLVGSSGVGKTTVIDLVTGLLKPQYGQILIDGSSLEVLDLKRWRQLIGYVPQENLLLHDTVLNNVTLNDPALDENDVEHALRAAGAWDFVTKMQQGMHSIVGERGAQLSGGQRQRIMIARALVHRPRLLILDEATSALDPESTASICETLDKLRGDITILAISHQPALVNAADQVYRLQDGRAILIGAQLLNELYSSKGAENKGV